MADEEITHTEETPDPAEPTPEAAAPVPDETAASVAVSEEAAPVAAPADETKH